MMYNYLYMDIGIIYMIQPLEVVDRYDKDGLSCIKIGFSNNPNLDRCTNGYKRGSKYLCIMECIKPMLLEKKIKDIFKEKFKLVHGREYFAGELCIMKQTFIDIINDHEKIYADDIKRFNIKVDDANFCTLISPIKLPICKYTNCIYNVVKNRKYCDRHLDKCQYKHNNTGDICGKYVFTYLYGHYCVDHEYDDYHI